MSAKVAASILLKKFTISHTTMLAMNFSTNFAHFAPVAMRERMDVIPHPTSKSISNFNG